MQEPSSRVPNPHPFLLFRQALRDKVNEQYGTCSEPRLSRQRGQAMFLLAVLLVFGVSAVIYTMVGTSSVSIANSQADDNARTMALVKDALIGWSASRTPTAGSPNRRPGELPCPDIDNTGTDSGSCSAGEIGRVPWKSLGIPEPKDGTGETLWYAVAGPFRHYNVITNPGPITSDTQGDLTVHVGSSASTVTSRAVAVLISAGLALDTQDRSAATTALCTTTGTTIARNLCATNYLEATGGGNNAQTGGPFIQAAASTTFNDRVLAITNEDLMPLVEQRVAREMRSLLEAYRTAYLVYPWADLSTGSSDVGYNRGRFPCAVASPIVWGLLPSTTLPAWLTNGCGVNGWASVIYYAAAKTLLPVGCITCDPIPPCLDLTLMVNGICGTSLVLLTPGGYTGAPARNWPNDGVSAITGYFEDAENSDNNDDRYATPTSTAYNRDRIYTTP